MAALRAFARWIGDSIGHAFGDPREEHATLPPNVGVQPYRDHPHRRRSAPALMLSDALAGCVRSSVDRGARLWLFPLALCPSRRASAWSR